MVLIGSFILLMTTGARTAIVGFSAAVLFMILLYGGKKAVIAGGLAALVLLPLFWATALHQPFLEKCMRVIGPAESRTFQQLVPQTLQRPAVVLVSASASPMAAAQVPASPPKRLATDLPASIQIHALLPLPNQVPTNAPMSTHDSIVTPTSAQELVDIPTLVQQRRPRWRSSPPPHHCRLGPQQSKRRWR